MLQLAILPDDFAFMEHSDFQNTFLVLYASNNHQSWKIAETKHNL